MTPGTYYVQGPSTAGTSTVGTTNPLQAVIPTGGDYSLTDRNIGYDPAVSGTISGTLFQDYGGGGTPGDGIQNGGEPGIAGETVSLYRDVNGNNQYDPGTDTLLTTAVTNGSGVYSFTGVAAGEYVIVPPGVIGTDTLGTPSVHDATISAASPSDTGNNFPYNQAGTITGTLWVDSTDNDSIDAGETLLAGQTVTLYRDANGNSTYDAGTDTLIATDTTDASGVYSFPNLSAGTYFVFAPSSASGNTYDTLSGLTNPRTVALNGGTSTEDFPYAPPTGGTVTGTLYSDDNLSNSYDGGESTFNSTAVTITVYQDDGDGTFEPGGDDGAGTAVALTTSSAGLYTISGLAPGFYWIDAPDSLSSQPIGTTDPLFVSVSSGVTNADNDFGYDPLPGSISGSLFEDDGSGGGTANNNIQDGTEPLVTESSTITLYLDNGDGTFNTGTDTLITSTTTSAGTYSFTGLTPGDYWVSAPSSYNGTFKGVNTGPNPLLVTVPSNTAVTDQDFGYNERAIIATVYYDLDRDGTHDPDEPYAPSITITISGGATGTDTTDYAGDAIFTGLPTGNYNVTITPTAPAGYTSNPTSETENLNNGQPTADVIFGLQPDIGTTGTVSGDVFGDVGAGANSGNDLFDTDESGFGNILITLLHAGPNGAFGDADDWSVSTESAADGSYSFSNIPAGNVRVIVDDGDGDLPSGATIPAGDATVTTTVTGGANTDVDFPFDGAAGATATIIGTVYRDEDLSNSKDGTEAGIGGIAVSLYRETNGTPGLQTGSDTLVTTVDSDGSGNYTFEDVTAGSDYYVDVDESDGDLPSGYVIGTPDPVTVSSLPAGSIQSTGFGFDPPGTISGTVFQDDVTVNGTQDAGEAGVPNVTVNLLDSTSAIIATTTTNAAGEYSFPGVASGDYTVDIDQSTVSLTNYTLAASTPDPSATITVTSGSSGTANFAYQPLGTISGTAFKDDGGTGSGTAGNNSQDGDEGGIDSMSVCYGLDNGDGAGTAGDGVLHPDECDFTTTTDSTGDYIFTGVADGTYLIWIDTSSGVPPGYSLPAAEATQQRTVASASSVAAYFPFDALGTISGTVFREDIASNNTQDSGESGIASIQITLQYAGPDGIFGNGDDTTTQVDTAADGTYSFTDLPLGSYRVTVDTADADLPANYTVGTTNPVELTPILAGSNEINFGFDPNGEIHGSVWDDANNDGVRNLGETGIGSVTIQLRNGAGVVIASTTTAADGSYSFTGLPDGSYTVVEIDPAGYLSTTVNSRPAAVSSGSIVTDIDFGDRVAPGAISGEVWNDNGGTGSGTAGNGTRDGDEAGIGSVTVQLIRDANNSNTYDAGDTLVSTTTTATSGSYSFTNLPPGEYLVIETDPSGYYSTTPNSLDVTVAAGTTSTGVDFGDQYPPPPGSVIGVVWNDYNGDGVRDPGEPGIAGVSVVVTDGVNTYNLVTDAGGVYSQLSVVPGTYTVTETDPAGFTSTTPNSVPGVVVTSGASSTVEFGDQGSPGTISGTVFDDIDGGGTQNAGEPGIASVTVALYKDTNGSGVYDPTIDTLVDTATTDGTGSYSFASVAPGSYIVVETDPAGYNSTTSNEVSVILPAAGAASANFGDQLPATTGSISGVLWEERGADTTFNSPDVGVAGVNVYLYNDFDGDGDLDDDDDGVIDAENTAVATTTTGPGGNYAFTGLANGNYITVYEPPQGYTPLDAPGSTSGPENPNGTLDLADVSRAATVASSNVSGVDLGMQVDPGALSGQVWNDLNGDGVINVGELPLSGVTINLYYDANGNGIFEAAELAAPVRTTLTALNGTYSFPSNIPGNYLVEEIDPAGYTSSTSNNVQVTIQPGNSKIVNFGDQTTQTQGLISGNVFDDVDNSGTDNGEAGIAGVTLTLTDGVSTYTTATDANGDFSFTNIPNGSWTLTETNPAGYTSTTPDSVNIVLSGGSATANFGDTTTVVPPPPPPPGGGGGGGDGAAAAVSPSAVTAGTGTGIFYGDPQITKEASVALARVGDPVTYIITATNPNSHPFTGAKIIETMPAQLDILSVTATAGTITISGSTITLDIGTLDAGHTVTMTVVTEVNTLGVPPDLLRNKACLSGTKDGALFGFLGSEICASVDLTLTADYGIQLPGTGERPLLVRIAGPLALALLGIVTAFLSWNLRRRREVEQ
ncbi:MAG: Cna B-type domain-containing protein [Anaerolineae bacterium]|nr:Cna B-type domain-containing protein [Anaerolineae bacterium]